VSESPEPTLSPLKRAFLALEQAHARIAALEDAARAPIAIIGLGCRVPGADDPAAFWRLLQEGRDLVGPVPADRWDGDALFDANPDTPGRIAAREAGFLRAPVGEFDPAFFGIAPREAQGMDPQQRLLLEVAWEALEHAGQAPDRLERSSTGVYIGAAGHDYATLQLGTGDPALLDPHYASGIAHSVLSGRVSYLLGLQGPSLTVDTACSSSLVAVHLACQALRQGDCRMALAGGVNLILSPDIYIALSRSRMLAPDGRCKTFDAAADGFGRGEGCGVIVCKRLADAQADGDRVLAVIRGSAVNQDGPSSGLTAPNGPAQEAVIREALARAGVAPGEVGYLEAHGTGTQLGDPLEVQAVTRVFGPGRDPGQPLLIGSVKTNFGHLEAAAGVTGLIKLVLSLRARAIPAHLHFRTPSPHIPWDDMPLRVPTALTPWPAIGGRRLGGVSSFGFSGTNAHVVVEEAPAQTGVATAGLQLFVLSARNRASLAALARRYAQAFAGRPDAELADLCFTAAVGRAQFPERATILARSVAELVERLEALADGRAAAGASTARVNRRDPARIAFLFAGQGAQHAGMARALYDAEPIFRAALDRCAAIADPLLPRPLREVIFAADGPLDQTQYTQPALFAVEYALAELWRAWGVTPDVLIGHSVGEYVAACLAGVFSLEDGLRLIVERGRLMQSLPPGGAMAAVFAGEGAVREELARHAEVSIGAVNGPEQTVISGAAAAVDAACASFAARGVRCQRLPVSHAFHSPLVEPILDRFEQAAAAVSLASPRLRLISNLTGALADRQEITRPRYWRRHLSEPVRFGDGLRALAATSPDICLELGPHPTLLSFARAAFAEPPALIPSLRKGRPDREQLLEALGALFLAGAPVSWRAVYGASGARLTDLPSHPYQRERFWFQGRSLVRSTGIDTGHPLLGVRLRAAVRDTAIFEGALSTAGVPYLADHRVHGRTILPATAFIELALAAGRALGGQRAVHDLVIAEPLVVAGDEPRVVQVVVQAGDRFEIASQGPAGEWILHAQGTLAAVGGPEPAESLAAVRARCPEIIDGAAHQAALAARGLAFGPSLEGVQKIHRRDGEALGEIRRLDPAIAGAGDYVLHPALLDACLQVMAAALPAEVAAGKAYLPLGIEEVRAHRAPGPTVFSHVVVDAADPRSGTLKARVTVLDEQGVVAELRGLALRAAAEPATLDPLYQIAWEEQTPWPAPAALAAQLAPALETLARTHDLAGYHQGFLAAEALSTDWSAAALGALGWAPREGDPVAAETLAAKLGVVPRYRRLLARLLDILAEDGLLRSSGPGWIVVRPPAPQDATARLPRSLAQHPTSRARLSLAGACGPLLSDILRGRADPLQALFPGGSPALAESLYRDAPEAQVFNQLARDTVQAAVEALPPGQRLRVLEVGGGTGGTTAWVAPILPPERTEYLFTDVGPLMVARAKETFAAHPFMEFAPLDLERDPAAQLGERRFDLIIAANVVHATADLKATLSRLRGLLAPGGALLMLEVAGLERWIDITFGLTEGWWRFTDGDLRPRYPLLSRARWLELLASEGFEAAAVGAEHPHSRQVLLLARKGLAPAGRWLIAADAGGVGEALSRQLRAAGGDATCARFDSDEWRTQLGAEGLTGVVHTGALERTPPGEESEQALVETQQASLGTLLALVQALGARSFAAGATPRLVILTRGAVAAGAGAVNLAQAPVWGMSKVVALEHPELRPLRIDLDPSGGESAGLVSLLESDEPEVAMRGAARLVPRLARLEPPAGPVRLEKGAHGVLDDLTLQPAVRRPPGPGEVEIQVVAGGLNFRDVMNAVAMRADPEPLGGECAGRIVAVGAGVTGLAPGDPVVATAEASFATYTVTGARHAARLPAGLSFEQAATLPFAFMTAHHALHALGELRAGQIVLIHAGAGGVGLAAIQLAQRAGATIFATAGSDEKRAFLRAAGVPQVMSSRTLDFADEVLALTGGRGVDLVLNSLAGDFIAASVRCLAPDGRFLEIGKRDIWTTEQFRRVHPAGQYHAIDLAALRAHDPERSFALFAEVMSLVNRGELRPLPLRTFPLERAAEAFRFMAQARHTGKIVLTSPDPGRSIERLDPGASYLVTGGLSGLGLLTAGRLVKQGARHLVLVGRRAPSEHARAAIAGLTSAGAQVIVEQADVSRPAEVARVLARAEAAAPLRGIVHAAGLLEDGALLQQTWERFARPLGAKVEGSWALHRLTRDRPLDFFVMYSSMASVLGSAGQANHAAANAFLDALAWHRRAQGLPALSIGWGGWSEVGAAADRGVDARLGAQGIDVITPAGGLALLDRLMRGAPPHVAVFPARWERFLAGDRASGRFFERMKTRQAPRPQVAPAPVASLAVQLEQAAPAQRSELLLAFVGEHVARVVGVASARSIDPDQPLHELGLDSLMAVELRNRLGTGLGLSRSLPATLVFDHPTLEALAAYLASILQPAPAPAVIAPRADAVGAIDDLSDEQIEALFAKKMGSPGG
jgi:acyl transferase domain-containing protein/NADPH:quinone reductase-like Zn-dependent oxidoreductase